MIQSRLKEISAIVEDRLIELLSEHCDKGTLYDAMRYSLMAGGKRLRPALCILTAKMFGDETKVIDFACALEMIHTYSLIHDDLPAMDDDNLRRGKPTNHVVYGEAIAILAGDGLLNLAFEVMISNVQKNKDNMINNVSAMKIAAQAAGVSGMIAGQVADIENEGKDLDSNILSYIHDKKTAALISAAVLSGSAIHGANKTQTEALKEYGECIGLVFQIVDDILDVTGDESKLGKTLGKDTTAGKQNFVSIYGLEKSKIMAKEKTAQAVNALSVFGQKSKDLEDIALLLLNRDK